MRLGKIQKAILEELKEAFLNMGDITAAIVTSGMSSRLAHKKLNEFQKKRLEYQTKRSLAELVKRGLIETIVKSGEPHYRFPANSAALRSLQFETLTLQKRARWDGVWHMVIFDIPERYAKARRAISKKVVDVGALRLQDSVFVYPFSWKDEIEFTAVTFKVLPYIRYIEARSIDGSDKLERYFGVEN